MTTFYKYSNISILGTKNKVIFILNETTVPLNIIILHELDLRAQKDFLLKTF